ncbi:hypothetical protein GE107_22505 [Cohnella sp. CFH 77786]|uniref:hypothetical protein n=1 Tax=Cohnella sp. CFH 77786 TaxID=2662265 RepID=UPI001C608222|nr:hypothetical protein [Cohnella sp. CFH 77786]MBW5448816.1 hypothetical protein [Cohnella sp. CFH 77786]
MDQHRSVVDRAVHRQLAADLFNAAWDVMDRTNRDAGDNELMIHMAHASRYHWGVVGTPLNWARGEWQISRAYALVGRDEPALHHAKSSLRLCHEHHLGGFDLGFAHEAMARAYALQHNDKERDSVI